jgi:hypothetical protein
MTIIEEMGKRILSLRAERAEMRTIQEMSLSVKDCSIESNTSPNASHRGWIVKEIVSDMVREGEFGRAVSVEGLEKGSFFRVLPGSEGRSN